LRKQGYLLVIFVCQGDRVAIATLETIEREGLIALTAHRAKGQGQRCHAEAGRLWRRLRLLRGQESSRPAFCVLVRPREFFGILRHWSMAAYMASSFRLGMSEKPSSAGASSLLIFVIADWGLPVKRL